MKKFAKVCKIKSDEHPWQCSKAADKYLRIILSLKISRSFKVSSWWGILDTRHLQAFKMADIASFFASFLSSSSVNWSSNAGTTSFVINI
jgi:hypothetical protein